MIRGKLFACAQFARIPTSTTALYQHRHGVNYRHNSTTVGDLKSENKKPDLIDATNRSSRIDFECDANCDDHEFIFKHGALCGQPTPFSHSYLFPPSGQRIKNSIINQQNANQFVTPFFTASDYAHRRRRLFCLMPVNSIVILPFQDVSIRSHDIHNSFRQESNAYYFSGLGKEMGVGPDAMPMLVMAKCRRGTWGGVGEETTKIESQKHSQRFATVLDNRDEIDGCELVSIAFIRDKNPSIELWEGTATGSTMGELLLNGLPVCQQNENASGSSGDDSVAPIVCTSSNTSNVVQLLHQLITRMAQAELGYNSVKQKAAAGEKNGSFVPRPWTNDRTFSALPKLFIKPPRQLNISPNRKCTITLDVKEHVGDHLLASLKHGKIVMGGSVHKSGEKSEGAQQGQSSAALCALKNVALSMDILLGTQHLVRGNPQGESEMPADNNATEKETESAVEVDIFRLSVEELSELLKKDDKAARLKQKGNPPSKKMNNEDTPPDVRNVEWPMSAMERHTRKEIEHLLLASTSTTTTAKSATSSPPSSLVELTRSVQYHHPWHAVMDLLRSIRVVGVERNHESSNTTMSVPPPPPPPNDSSAPPPSGAPSFSHSFGCCYAYAFPASAHDVFSNPIGLGGGLTATSADSASDPNPNTMMRRQLLFPRTPIFEVSGVASAGTNLPLSNSSTVFPRSASQLLQAAPLTYWESLIPSITSLNKSETRAVFGEERMASETICDSSSRLPPSLPLVCLGTLFGSSSASTPLSAAPFISIPPTHRPKSLLIVRDPETAGASHGSSEVQGTMMVPPASPSLLRTVRAIKTPQELGVMMKCSRITEKAMTRAMRESLVSCYTEGDVYRLLQQGVWEEGARLNNEGIIAREWRETALQPDGKDSAQQSCEDAEELSISPLDSLRRELSNMHHPSFSFSPLNWRHSGVVSPTLGYIPVVASGGNALCIHYIENNAVLGRGGGSKRQERKGKRSVNNDRNTRALLRSRDVSLSCEESPSDAPYQQWMLVDAGGELEGYSTDCSRSWPVVPLPQFCERMGERGARKQTPAETVDHEQQTDPDNNLNDCLPPHSRLYNTLLRVQKTLLSAVAIGQSIPSLHSLCLKAMHHELTKDCDETQRQTVQDGEKETTVMRSKQRSNSSCTFLSNLSPSVITPRFVSQFLMPHNVGHFIGMDVHEYANSAPQMTSEKEANDNRSENDPKRTEFTAYNFVLASIAEESASKTGSQFSSSISESLFNSITRDLSAEPKEMTPKVFACVTRPPPAAETSEPSVPSIRTLSTPFVGGMALTVEPGIYIPSAPVDHHRAGCTLVRGCAEASRVVYGQNAAATCFPSNMPSAFAYEGVGMRIEDNVLVLPPLEKHYANASSPLSPLAILRASYVRTAFEVWLATHDDDDDDDSREDSHAAGDNDANHIDRFTKLLQNFYEEQTNAIYEPLPKTGEAFDCTYSKRMRHFENYVSAVKSVTEDLCRSPTAPSLPNASPLFLLADLLLSPRPVNFWFEHDILVITSSIPKDYNAIVKLVQGTNV